MSDRPQKQASDLELSDQSTFGNGVVVIIIMDLIHYLFAPLILLRVPYTLNLLPYYLLIANGTGGVGIFKLLVFQCFV